MSAILRVLGWTPSRFAKYKECPAKVKYEDLLKMCPVCFKGRVSGGHNGEPVQCDTCSKPQPEREALDRGNALDAALTLATAGQPGSGRMDDKEHRKLHKVVSESLGTVEAEQVLTQALRHPIIAKMQKKLAKAKGVTLQESIVLNNKWERVGQFTKNAWARLKLDVLVVTGKVAKVIDWKSGNIDKSKGIIRERDEYHDSMRAYQLAVLSVYPEVKEAHALMVFLDAPPKLEDPTKAPVGGVLKRADLAEAKAKWEDKIRPMMNDTIFAPRPGYYCGWCPFSKKVGGPCPH